jgi:hypothetical protein
MYMPRWVLGHIKYPMPAKQFTQGPFRDSVPAIVGLYDDIIGGTNSTHNGKNGLSISGRRRSNDFGGIIKNWWEGRTVHNGGNRPWLSPSLIHSSFIPGGSLTPLFEDKLVMNVLKC